MVNSQELKQVLKELLSPCCPSPFFYQCPPGAGFPRTEYDFKQLNVDNQHYDKVILTVNFYDKGTQEAIDAAADALETQLDKVIHFIENNYYQFYYNHDRQSVPDPDKTLRRVMLTYEIRIYKRSE